MQPVSWDKKAQIVIDEVNTTLRPLKECFKPENGYPDDMFIPSQLALDEIDSHTALIVVDTNRSELYGMSESAEPGKDHRCL